MTMPKDWTPRECGVDGCRRPHSSLGYCKSHAARLRRYGDPGPATFRLPKRSDDETDAPGLQCAVSECRRRKWALGYCATHYRRWTRHGDVNHVTQPKGVPKKQCSSDKCEAPQEALGLCTRHYQQQYRRQTPPNPSSQRARSRRFAMKKYGITLEEYESLLDAQGGKCAICQSPHPGGNGRTNYSWPVDHDHATGKVRGLLCRNCNVGLGLLGDSETRVAAALTYLRQAR